MLVFFIKYLYYNIFGDIMRTIKENFINEIVIKNSRFICYLFKINSPNIDDYINNIKIEHPKATHYCYGYKYLDIEHSSDDGEPSGTAGMPILNVIKKEQLQNILIVVVRYFGGIKLGAGGLIRAYTKSVTEAIKNNSLCDLVDAYKILLSFSYEVEKDVSYILRDSIIIEKSYLDIINFTCIVDYDVFKLLEKYSPTIIEKTYIEKLN